MPDIFHLQWVKGVEKFTWVQEFDIKLIVSLRGAHINYSPLADQKLAQMYKTIFPEIDGFHGVSKAICKEASLYGADLKKCQVVYSGFNLKEYPKENWTDKVASSEKQTIEILSVGRSHWKKGYHFALDAMKLLKDSGIKFTYTIIGGAGNEELMFQRNQLGLENEVEFKSSVSFEEVKRSLKKADLFLLPSVEEGIANVVIESMLNGT